MTSVDLGRVRALVEQALDLPPAERARFLRAACGADRALLREVEEILGASERDPGFLELPWSSELSDALAREIDAVAAPPPVGGFRLVRRVAVGGMGAVWEAEQDEPRRKVAIKMLRSAVASEEMRRRFRHEAAILARLQHPHIAQVFASGVVERAGDDVPWYAMEFVEGARTLVDFAREDRLELRARVRLFLDLCAAVQHGHDRGVIHRDLKPGNVLIDAAGVLKVIDFGVARVSAPEGRPHSQVTEAGRVIGTLQYMSPEQLAGASDGLDVRSDVYALGVLLYQLGACPSSRVSCRCTS